MPNKNCQICGKSFYAKPIKDGHINRGKFCSRICFNEYQKSEWKEIECDNCHNVFKRPLWRFRTKPMKHYFCSDKCFYKYRKDFSKDFPVNGGKRGVFRQAQELTEQLLLKEYLENNMTINKIAEKYNTSYSLVNSRLKSFNIPTRRCSDYFNGGLTAKYWQRFFQKKIGKCQVCGWDKDVCDVAHKIARRLGGKFEEDNLYYLCPNCHRLYDKGMLKI